MIFKVPKFYRVDYIASEKIHHVYCTIAPDRAPDLVAKLRTEEEVNSFFNDLTTKSNDRQKEMLTSILSWWDERQFDVWGGDHNVYDDEPEFVTIAKSLRGHP